MALALSAGKIALTQEILPIATHFSVAWSLISHIHAPGLNRSTDLHAIQQAHFLSHSGPLFPGEDEIYGSNPATKTCNCKPRAIPPCAELLWSYFSVVLIYLFIYYMVYTHVKSFTTVKNRKCGQVTSHCGKARPYRADFSLFLNVPVVTVKSEITV